MTRRIFVVERLSLAGWARMLALASGGEAIETVLHAYSTVPGRLISRLARRALGVSVEPLSFEVYSLTGADGVSVLWRVLLEDLASLREKVVRRPSFVRAVADTGGRRWPSYVAKRAIAESSGEPPVDRALILVRFATTLEPESPQGVTVLYRARAWSAAISDLADTLGVRAEPVGRVTSNMKDRTLDILGSRSLRLRDALRRVAASLRGAAPPLAAAARPALAVQYYGQLNLDHPELHSDLAFLQGSQAVDPADVRLLLELAADPMDEQRAGELARHGVQAIALDAMTDPTGKVPVFYHMRGGSHAPHARPSLDRVGEASEWRWLRRQASRYSADVDYWADLFRRSNARVFMSWYKSSSDHMAIADALRSVGGTIVLYQRSLEDVPSPVNATTTDVFFAYAPSHSAVELAAGSQIPYHVAIGYLGDHRFELLRDDASAMRARLAAAGAEHVLAFFDENSADDPRWTVGHREISADYESLLTRVLEDPSAGLILKPKVPASLRRRLGPVSELLDQAVATGRCVNLGSGPLHSPIPPAAAALAADVACGYASGSTAAFESALAGVPSLLLNHGRFPSQELSRLPEGRVVFRSWDDLWAACQEHFRAGGRTDLGVWGEVLDVLDPFRDGRAAERMGDYLGSLLAGLRDGRAVETVLADTAERYARTWGDDKVTEVTQGGWPRL